ncbi:hypothetical protein D3H65_21440 [Paraflavitalea soli]|uniref:Uncharacterized protein n=1 Tax=Paraflavitalea soli TaxID=2315862 RepID=A0A3B7MPH0_9BACT|nr:hypothetical protein [Paraflavitalea soli]AXY76402.1 hypothetical protein D3H65_21440 [Paraflavitalea soli]
MARQIGVIPITGTIDELTFYETPDDGALVRKKSRVTGEMVKTDPKYHQTMLNAAEFKTAIHNGRLLRKALARLLFPIADGKLSSRMNKEMLKVIQKDTVNRFGERIAHGNQLCLLEGFQFNRHLTLADTFLPSPGIHPDGEKGAIQIEVPGFTPTKDIKVPKYVKHIQLISGAVVIDFADQRYTHEFYATERIVHNKEAIDEIQFTYRMNIPAGYTMFLALGILYYAPLDNVPKETISKRKRRRVKKIGGADDLVPFTGALSLVKVIAGEPREKKRASDNDGSAGWEMDGLGIA